jgi:hypothetical protein
LTRWNAGASLKEYSIENEFDYELPLIIQIKFVINFFTTTYSDTIKILPNLLSRQRMDDFLLENRTTPYCFDFPTIEIDTVLINLPMAMEKTSTFNPSTLNNDLIDYELNTTLANKTLQLTRKFHQKSECVSPERHAELRSILDQISNQDHLQVSLVAVK